MLGSHIAATPPLAGSTATCSNISQQTNRNKVQQYDTRPPKRREDTPQIAVREHSQQQLAACSMHREHAYHWRYQTRSTRMSLSCTCVRTYVDKALAAPFPIPGYCQYRCVLVQYPALLIYAIKLCIILGGVYGYVCKLCTSATKPNQTKLVYHTPCPVSTATVFYRRRLRLQASYKE